MKKLIALLLTMIMLCAALPTLAEEAAGGWSAAVDSTVTEEAAAALNAAVAGLDGCTYEAVALLGTQVVAGTNYALLCRLTPVVPDAVPQYAIVFVYMGVDGTAEVLQIRNIELGLTDVDALVDAGDGAANNMACAYDEAGDCYEMFQITKLLMDENNKVYGVEGHFARIDTAEDGTYYSKRLPETFFYSFAADFTAMMLNNDLDYVEAPDLYSWYVETYLDGQAPADGEELNFWFVTVRIALNENEEISYMEGVYVPWA